MTSFGPSALLSLLWLHPSFFAANRPTVRRAMSLNFVSSAVLTSTDGVSHNEEKAVESTEADSVRRQQQAGGHKPLFEQLRSNADTAQEERDAAAKAMRGTRTLDEEDCAHLDSIERQRMERDAAVRRGVEDEVAAFRAARAERMAEGSTELLEGEEGGDIGGAEVGLKIAATKPSIAVVHGAKEANAPSLATLAQKVVIKKKRKRQPNGQSASNTHNDSNVGDAASKRPKDADKDVDTKKDGDGTKGENQNDGDDKSDRSSADEGAGGLGALLGGYGSDSDSD